MADGLGPKLALVRAAADFDPAVGHPDPDPADALRRALTVLTALAPG